MHRITLSPPPSAWAVLLAMNCRSRQSTPLQASNRSPSSSALFLPTPPHLHLRNSTYPVFFPQNRAPLAVPDERPLDPRVGQLACRDLAGEGAVGPVEDVLRRDLEAGAEVLAREEEVQGGRSDDNLCAWWSYGSAQSEIKGNAEPRMNVGGSGGGVSRWCGEVVPVFSSSFASLRFVMMSLMVWIVPFLERVSLNPRQAELHARPESKRGEHFEIAAYKELARHDHWSGAGNLLEGFDFNVRRMGVVFRALKALAVGNVTAVDALAEGGGESEPLRRGLLIGHAS